MALTSSMRRKAEQKPTSSAVLSTPRDHLTHIFSFFSAKDLARVVCVNKRWQKIGEAVLNQNEDRVFYAVGNNMHAMNLSSKGSGLQKPVPRAEIKPEEIRRSFPNEGVVRLFNTEQAALDYSRSLRTNVTTQVFTMDNEHVMNQPAVFAVRVIRDIPSVVSESKLAITNYFNQPIRNVVVNYREVDARNIVLLVGKVKYKLKETDEMKVYVSITYKKVPQLESVPAPTRCITM